MNLRGGKQPVHKDMNDLATYTEAKFNRYQRLCDRLSIKPIPSDVLEALNFTNELEVYKAKIESILEEKITWADFDVVFPVFVASMSGSNFIEKYHTLALKLELPLPKKILAHCAKIEKSKYLAEIEKMQTIIDTLQRIEDQA